MKVCPNCGFEDDQRKAERRGPKFSPEQFAIFWRAYPRKVGKGAAERVWEKLRGDDAMFQKIIQAVEDQKMSEPWQRDNGMYIPHPSTWLHQKRWEDEVVMVPQAPQAAPERMEQKLAELEKIKEREFQRLMNNREVRG